MTTTMTTDSEWDLSELTAAPARRTRRAAATTVPAVRDFPANAALRLIAACLRANVPVLIWDEPGTTKTASLTHLASFWGYFTQVITGSNREPTDLLGYPVPGVDEDGTTTVTLSTLKWAKDANAHDASLILADEFNTNPNMFAAFLRVIQEKVVGELQLGPGVRIAAICNPPECSVNGVDLPAPAANRFIHVDWMFDTDGWLDGLGSNFENARTYPMDSLTVEATPERKAWVYGLVTNYLRRNRSAIKPGVPRDASKASRGWASPRAWTNLMNVLCCLDPSDMAAVALAAEGAVGKGQGTSFVAYVTTVGLFDPEEVLKNPESVDWTDSARLDRLYALTMALRDIALTRNDAKVWMKVMDVLVVCDRQGRHDTPMIACKDLLANRPAGATITAEMRQRFHDWIA